MIQQDIQFMKGILPNHYTVQESKKSGSVHCKSSIGIRKGIDAEDDEHWGYIMDAIRTEFGGRLQEVYHNTCSNHVDFTVYLNNKYTGMVVTEEGLIGNKYTYTK